MSRRKKQGMLGAVIAVAALVLVFQLALGMDPTTVFADDSGLTETQTVDDAAASQDDVATSGEEAGSADASAQSLSPAQSFEVTADNNVVVKVDAPEGALPEGVELHADVVTETEDVASELDNAGVSYDGFVALDVYFTNADGTEVEPAQAVDVRFELPSGLVPEDAESVSVQHLAEDETGAVTDVQTVADNSDAATLSEDSSADKGTVSVNDDSTVTAEFSVDGFSWFTISYGERNTVYVYLVDANGAELWNGQVNFENLSSVYDPTDFEDKYIADQWISIEELAGTWASKTQGYSYERAYTTSTDWWSPETENDVTWIRYNTSGRNRGWRYSSQEQTPSDSLRGSSLDNLYLVFSEVAETGQSGPLTIMDNVVSDGALVANYTNASEFQDPYYVWEKSSDGQDWETIDRQRMTGDEYNLTENGQELNVALEVVNDEADEGGQWFRVSVYESRESYENGGEALASSNSFQLDYYDELRNGSFETPNVEDLGTSNSNYQYPVGSDGLIWNTTGSDQQVEIVNENTDRADESSDFNNMDGAFDEVQYAELNCQSEGALYQDVLTVPGSSLNWQFSHRGRDGVDTMYLVIAPADKVEDITTQDELDTLIRQIESGQSGYRQEDGYYLFKASDGNFAWSTYRSDISEGASPYEVPDGQYLTRFFFVSGDTASRKNGKVDRTCGNLLDNVLFTTEMLPPNKGTANLMIEKVVQGVADEDIDKYSVDLTLSGEGFSKKVTISRFAPQGDGTYVGTAQVTVDEIAANGSKTVTVSEDAPNDFDGYTYTGSTVEVNDGGSSGGIIAEITLSDTGEGTVTFTNSYEKDFEKPTVYIYKYDASNESIGLVNTNFSVTADTAEDGTVTEVSTDSNGYAELGELDKGAYTIQETYVSAGYQLDSSDHLLVIGEDAEGNVTVTFDGGTLTPKSEGEYEGSYVVEIANTAMEPIPSTGGFGNLPLYITGAAAVAGSVIALRRRQQAR